jgi:hypothetical protein
MPAAAFRRHCSESRPQPRVPKAKFLLNFFLVALAFGKKQENNRLFLGTQEANMVSKCANPECSAPFLYFRQGKLFRLETEGRHDRRRQLGDEQGAGRCLRRIEFYWLCEDCSATMTLSFDKNTGMSVRPQVPAISEGPAAAAAA